MSVLEYIRTILTYSRREKYSRGDFRSVFKYLKNNLSAFFLHICKILSTLNRNNLEFFNFLNLLKP